MLVVDGLCTPLTSLRTALERLIWPFHRTCSDRACIVGCIHLFNRSTEKAIGAVALLHFSTLCKFEIIMQSFTKKKKIGSELLSLTSSCSLATVLFLFPAISLNLFRGGLPVLFLAFFPD